MSHFEKIRAVGKDVNDALSAALAKHFPTATDGSMDPLLTHLWETTLERVVTDWVAMNVPPADSGPRFKEHPEIERPQWSIELGFEDHSWRNDAAALSILTCKNGLEIHLWTNYGEGERELPHGCAALLQKPNGADHVLETLYEGESDQECEAAVRTYLAAVDAKREKRHGKK